MIFQNSQIQTICERSKSCKPLCKGGNISSRFYSSQSMFAHFERQHDLISNLPVNLLPLESNSSASSLESLRNKIYPHSNSSGCLLSRLLNSVIFKVCIEKKLEK